MEVMMRSAFSIRPLIFNRCCQIILEANLACKGATELVYIRTVLRISGTLNMSPLKRFWYWVTFCNFLFYYFISLRIESFWSPFKVPDTLVNLSSQKNLGPQPNVYLACGLRWL